MDRHGWASIGEFLCSSPKVGHNGVTLFVLAQQLGLTLPQRLASCCATTMCRLGNSSDNLELVQCKVHCWQETLGKKVVGSTSVVVPT